MKFLLNPYCNILIFLCFISFTLSCEVDYTEIGNDVINNQNISIDNQSYPAKTYNKRISFPVEQPAQQLVRLLL